MPMEDVREQATGGLSDFAHLPCEGHQASGIMSNRYPYRSTPQREAYPALPPPKPKSQERPVGNAPVNADLLAPNRSVGWPEFVRRGYYMDIPFTCKACGAGQIWTSHQQKWWYEVAKGDVFRTANRCRACRRRERERRNEARQVHVSGVAEKARRGPA
jgi:hypothetical protein